MRRSRRVHKVTKRSVVSNIEHDAMVNIHKNAKVNKTNKKHIHKIKQSSSKITENLIINEPKFAEAAFAENSVINIMNKKIKVGQFVAFGIGGADKAAENLVKGLLTCENVEVLVFYDEFSIPKMCSQYDNSTKILSRFDNYKNVEVIKIEKNNIIHLNDFGLDILNTHRSGDDFWHLINLEKTDVNYKIVETNFGGFINTKADIRIYPSKAVIRDKHAPYTIIPNAIMTAQSLENVKAELNLEEKIIFGRIAPPRVEIYTSVNLEAYKKIETDQTAFLYVAPCEQAMLDAKNLEIKNIVFVDQTLDDVLLSKLYNTIDVFCHSNRWGETFGMTIAEAMIHNIPVISHHGCQGYPQAQPELLGDKANELYVKNNIVDNYSQLMKKLLEDELYRKTIREYCKSRADNIFDYKKVAKKYENVYRSLLI